MIKLKLITPEQQVLEEEVLQVTLPTLDGEITILPDHESYISTLGAGEICVKKPKGEDACFATAGGFIEFRNNTLSILADTAERAEEIDIEQAEEARKRAEELKKEKHAGDMEYAELAAIMERELARIRVARKYRSRKTNYPSSN